MRNGESTRGGARSRWRVAAVLLLAASGWASFAALRWTPAPVTVVTSRPLSRLFPPLTYDTDRARLSGLVIENLCPVLPALRAPHLRTPEAIASCEVAPDERSVTVTIRDGTTWGTPGKRSPVDAASLIKALERYQGVASARGSSTDWERAEKLDEYRVRLWPRDGATAPDVRAELGSTPVARPCEGASVRGNTRGEALDWTCVEGTGPFRVKELRERVEPAAADLSDGALPAEVGAAVTDRLTLEACPDTRVPTCRTVVFYGLPQGVVSSNVATALAEGLGHTIHLLQDLEAPTYDALESMRRAAEPPPSDWDIGQRRDLRVLWAVIRPASPDHPGAPDDAARCAIREALEKVAYSDAFIRSVGGRPTSSLLPSVLPYVPVRPPSCPEGASLPAHVTLLTNTSWSAPAAVIQAALGWTVETLDPTKEDSRRRSGDYDVSLLSIGATTAPTAARFLAGNFAIWFPTPVAPATCLDSPDTLFCRADALSRAELSGTLDPDDLVSLLSELSSDAVPLASVPTSYAYRRNLLGWSPDRLTLDPMLVGVAGDDRPAPWLAGLLGGLGLVVFFTGELTAALTLSRTQRVLAQVAGLHHDLMAPLSTIRAWAQGLADREASEEILRLVDDALDMVDSVALTTPGEGWRVRFVGVGRWEEVLDRVVVDAERRAAGEGRSAHLVVTAEPAAAATELGLPATWLRRIATNLVGNAIRYSKSLNPEVRITVLQASSGVSLIVEDDGPGFDIDPEVAFGLGVHGPRAHSGTGIGLAVVKAAVDEAGGRVAVTSPSHPTRVEVWLPPAKGSTLTARAPREEETP